MSEIKVPAGLASGEGSLPGLLTASSRGLSSALACAGGAFSWLSLFL